MEMDCGIDDMFKSFVNNKMKQLGMDGSTAVELEKSLQKSVLEKLDLSVNRTGKDACVPKKRKKEKKSKKHKKYKKSEKDFKQDSDSVVCDSFHSSISTFEESNSSSPQESSCFSAKNNCNAASCALVCENNSSQFNSEDKVAEQSNNFYVSSKEGVLKPADNSKRSSKRHHHRHRSRSPKRRHHHHTHRSSDSKSRKSRRSRSKSPIISAKDKMKLLEIAKANVLAQYQAGTNASNLSIEKKALLCSGGVTLQQLTGVCKDISEGKRQISSFYNKDEEAVVKVKHPFQVREPPAISINIKTSIPPIISKSINELTKEYPVSCGYQHQCKESLEEVYGKWEPIIKTEQIETKKASTAQKVISPAAAENELNIKDVIAQRVSAVRNLNTNPNDINAMKDMADIQNKLNSWTSSKLIPGQFTGANNVQPLTKDQLTQGQQAWVNQNSLNSCKRVDGIGKCLLQKMGWKEGESLGKTNLGLVEPLKMQIKTDRKGLSSVMEEPITVPSFSKKQAANPVTAQDFSGKHPVSAIMEICSKRKWKPPDFVLVQSDGPDHHRSFLFKVMVNGVFYQPSSPSVNKKQAKAQAAAAALQSLGLIS